MPPRLGRPPRVRYTRRLAPTRAAAPPPAGAPTSLPLRSHCGVAFPDSPGVILSAHPAADFVALSEIASMPLLSPPEKPRRRIVVSSSAPAVGRRVAARASWLAPLLVAGLACASLGSGLVFGAAGCAEDTQADTVLPGPAPSAPAGVQGGGGSGSIVDTRCFNAAEIGAFVTISDDFPWCVVAVHAAQYGDDDIDAQNFSAFGQPSWFQDGAVNGPLTGGKTRPAAPGAATSLDKWTIPGGNRSPATQNFLDVTAELVPGDSVFTAALGLYLNPVSFTLLAHASPSGDRLGETFLVNATGFIRSTVNGIVAVAPPQTPTPETMFYYTGLSAFYEGESPAKAAGLYRTSCDLDATTCTSSLVTGWTDTPGLVASDIAGNLVAVHSSFGAGREIVGFTSAALSGGGEVSGDSLLKDANIAKSMTISTTPDQREYLFLVETTANDVAQPVAVRGVTFDADNQSAALTDETVPGSLTAAAGVRLQVFHDPSGQLWIAADTNGNDAGGTPTFLVLSPRAN
jgi:hypothetical protein